MTVRGFISLFRRREDGASLIEYTVVISLFLLVFFAILDFGRLGFNWVMTEKAMQRAARIATVRPPICTGVPETHTRLGTSSEPFGTLCRVGAVCADGGAQACTLGAATDFTTTGTNPCTVPVTVPTLGNNPTAGEIATRNTALRRQAAQEIWCVLAPILPSNSAPNNIILSYTYDANLGFAGGPYVPMVEVAVATANDPGGTGAERLCFDFITPIPGMAALVGGVADIDEAPPECANGLASIPFPDLSVSLPGEDLNQGPNG